MKKTLFLGVLLGLVLVVPVNAQVTTSQTQKSPTSSNVTSELEILKDEPLSTRRVSVVAQLEDIRLKLAVLYDKTKFAANRLSQHNVDISNADESFSVAAAALADAKTITNTLSEVLTDPMNASDENLMIGDLTFKESVASVEAKLREGRGAIIAALSALKAAVTPTTTQ